MINLFSDKSVKGSNENVVAWKYILNSKSIFYYYSITNMKY
jgi:hypothetical protein